MSNSNRNVPLKELVSIARKIRDPSSKAGLIMLVSLITIEHKPKLHSKGDSENRKGFSSIHSRNMILLTLSSSCFNCNVLLIELVNTAREIRALIHFGSCLIMLVSLITIQHKLKLHSKGDSENRKGFSSIHRRNVILLTLRSSCVNCNVLLIELVITAREIRALIHFGSCLVMLVSLITSQHKLKLHSKGDSENRKGFSSIHGRSVILLTLSSSCVNCNVVLI